jgi:signal transduction histidine kinase
MSYSYRKKAFSLKTEFNQLLHDTQMEVQAETIRQITAEIHDNVGQKLSLAKLYLNTIDLHPAEKSKKVSSAVDCLTDAIDCLRDLTGDPSLELLKIGGLIRAVEAIVLRIKKTGVYNVKFIKTGSSDGLDEQKGIVIFRIIQECLNNILCHASAKNIAINLKFSESTLLVSINDDGKGFDFSPLSSGSDNKAPGRGIPNMKARSELIQADFLIDTRPGNGTKINIVVPLKYAV